MNAQQIRATILSALRRQGFEQVSSRSYARSAELVWVVQPRKAQFSRWYAIDVGALSVRLRPDLAYPAYSECHFGTDYAFIGEKIPPAAVGTRFDDHRSYFAIALAVDNEQIDDVERREAIEFATADLKSITSAVSTLESFGSWRDTEARESYLHPAMRQLLG